MAAHKEHAVHVGPGSERHRRSIEERKDSAFQLITMSVKSGIPRDMLSTRLTAGDPGSVLFWAVVESGPVRSPIPGCSAEKPGLPLPCYSSGQLSRHIIL